MANKKILLKSTSGDNLYPRTSIDNLVDTVGSTVSVSVPVLDANGKLDSSYLPSYVDDIVDLKAITGTAPSTCAKGDMYFNSTSGNLKIYTATAANTWGTTGTTPETGKIYVNLADSKIYRWSGSAMVEISKQVSTVTSVRATSSATDTVVPTEKAVATALGGKAASSHTHTKSQITDFSHTHTKSEITDFSHTHAISEVTNLQSTLDGKQGKLTAGTNISISNGTVSCTYSYTPSYTSDIASAASNGLGQAPTTAAVKTYVAAEISGATSAVMGEVNELLDGKQDTLTAGTNISISNGTISNTYSYTLPDASTSVKGGVKVTTTASNGVALAISSGTLSVSTTAASTSAKGTVQLATTTEASTGTDTSKAVTPAGVKAALASYITFEELT